MKSIMTLTVVLVATTFSLNAQARGMHKSKPLSFEELPPVCQAYFTRAEKCYAKVDEKASLFHKGNTDFLRQVLPAALPEQRVRMCEIADRDFAAKAAQLKCE